MPILTSLCMGGNDAAFCFAFQHHVTATLTNLLEPEPFESALYVGTRDVRQLRHVLAREP